ncbi:MAG: hypothetical protein JWQ14_1601 [Adhaeribacter sp.]|nr:hypothetical protein [Adhaeribacter sp.]
MAFNKEKPDSGKFASGNKFKGRASAAGKSDYNRPSRPASSGRRPTGATDSRPPREGNAGAGRPFREDRMAKFKGEGEKVYNRSERFTRPADGAGARTGGDDRSRPFDDKRSSFKSAPKFSKGASFKGNSRPSEGNERNGVRPSFNRGADRPERTERPERGERSERPERPERSGNKDNDRGERPRYAEKRNSEGGYAARGERRAAPTGSRPAYPAKTYGAKPAGTKTYGGSDRRADNPGGDKPRFNKFSGSDENRGREKRESDRPESRSGGFNREEKSGGERRSFERPRSGSPRPAPSTSERSFSRERPERDRRTGKEENKRPARGRAEEVGEAPTYDLKRYQGREKLNEKNEDGLIRLNRYIANAGVCSRREADSLIAAGEIKVNGEPITEMGYLVKPEDTVTYGKKRLNREKMVYVLLNKPKDFITTTEDPEGRKTVMDLVNTASKERIFPVGRLDRNTTGLLLFTNDGELAQKLTHPSNTISKIYQVELDKPITRAHFEMITNGIELEDGKAEVDDLAIIGDTNTFLGIQIHIGKNRIVRRIFEHLGYEVVSLDRVQYAGLTKKDVTRGKWRFLTEKEVIRLKYFL